LHPQPGLQQTPLHTVFGHTQVALEQISLDGQTCPQDPQLLESFRIFVSQPLLGLPSQLPKPKLQNAMTQVPFEQALVAFGRLQTCPQVAQLLGSVCKFTQIPKQQLRPVGQLTHVPPRTPHTLLLVPGWQVPLASQQPGLQLVELQTHVPAEHSCPAAHLTQVAPLVPHAAALVPD